MAMNEPAFPLEGESPVAIYPLELGSIEFFQSPLNIRYLIHQV
jgi:hypothetical protein